YFLSVCVFIILFIGGCGLMSEKDISKMDPEDLPDVTAFQDDFTREVMSSTEEVGEGYYLFESKTGGYTMWYPEEAIMNKGYYERTKDTFERVSFGVEANKDKSNIPYYVVASYNHLYPSSKNVHFSLLIYGHYHHNIWYIFVSYDISHLCQYCYI